MTFANPLYLLLLALMPWLNRYQRKYVMPAAWGYPSTDERLGFSPPSNWRSRWQPRLSWLRWLVLSLLIVALARPQWGVQSVKVYRQGIAIAMVVDISSSMGAQDLKIDERAIDRLAVVKRTFEAFVRGDELALSGRDGDSIGLFAFARYTDALSPLTLDHDALLVLAAQLQMVALPEEDGTAIGDAIMAGLAPLRDHGDAGKVMILLTDGSHNAGDISPLQAAQSAKALGIKIYTIGAGTRGVAMMPARKRGGGTELRPTLVFIDDEALTEVAEVTGGRYFRATDGQGLQTIYAEIDRLETGDNVVESYQEYVDVFAPFVLLAVALAIIEFVLAQTIFRTVP